MIERVDMEVQTAALVAVELGREILEMRERQRVERTK